MEDKATREANLAQWWNLVKAVGGWKNRSRNPRVPKDGGYTIGGMELVPGSPLAIYWAPNSKKITESVRVGCIFMPGCQLTIFGSGRTESKKHSNTKTINASRLPGVVDHYK
jgi:hypothetical protein